MKNSKFIPLYETITARYKEGAGFLEGDIIKLKSNYKSLDAFKELNETVKARIEDAEKTGYNLRVARLHTPNNQYGSYGYIRLPATHADIYQEKAPGYFSNITTVPLSIIEAIDTGVNLAPISQNNRRDNGENQKPQKWKSNKDTPETKEQNHLGHDENWVKNGNYELAEKNKKPGVGANDYDDTKPSTGYKPLPKNKLKPKTLKESEQALDSLYIHILREDGNESQRVEEDIGMMGSESETAYNEEICPKCGKHICECHDMEALCPVCHTNPCTCLEETADNDDEAKIDAFVDSLPADYNKPFFKDCLTGMKPGMSWEEFQDKLWHNLYAHNLKQRGNDPHRAKTATDNKMWYMDDGDFPADAGQDYKAIFGHFPGSQQTQTMEEGEEVYDESDLKHHVKDECWNMEENRLVDECWGEDGSVKEECWASSSNAEPAPAQQLTGQEAGTREDGPMEESEQVKRAYLPGGHPKDGVTIKAHPNSYLS